MTTLNHTNLSTTNVPELTEFFRSVFGFQLLDQSGDKMAVLRNHDGFVLTLTYDKNMIAGQDYPPTFHVGFLQPTAGAVDRVHREMEIRCYTPPAPARLKRGGPPAYGFYCNAPGGVVVEVSTMNMGSPGLRG
jgi:catechol 2,3-dioxygenase-like lactoylglutathione lyase family enzyme